MQEMQDDTAAFDMQPSRVKIAPGGIGQFLLFASFRRATATLLAPFEYTGLIWAAACPCPTRRLA